MHTDWTRIRWSLLSRYDYGSNWKEKEEEIYRGRAQELKEDRYKNVKAKVLYAVTTQNTYSKCASLKIPLSKRFHFTVYDFTFYNFQTFFTLYIDYNIVTCRDTVLLRRSHEIVKFRHLSRLLCSDRLCMFISIFRFRVISLLGKKTFS